MKKQGLSILVLVTVGFSLFTLGLYLGRNTSGSSIQVSVPASLYTTPQEITLPTESDAQTSITFPININSADKEALMALPGIGEDLAQRILDYRQAVILFSAPEELINIEGIGEKRLEEILDLITIGG